MANADDIAAAPKGPSFIVQIAMLLAMTVAALGVGWVSGSYLKSSQEPPSAATAAPAKAEGKPEAKAEGEAAKHAEQGAGSGMIVAQLPPITTNLAAPATVWVRMDASVVLDAPQPDETIQAIHQDLLAYLRTLKMHQIEGPSGYQHLRADLQERAAMRSAGHAKDVLIRTLLFE